MSVIIIISPPKNPTASKVFSLGKTTGEMFGNILNKLSTKLNLPVQANDSTKK
jgi:hypothetical protein